MVIIGLVLGAILMFGIFFWAEKKRDHKCSWTKWTKPSFDTKQRECELCGNVETFADIHTHQWGKWSKYNNIDRLYRDCDICNIREEHRY